MLQGSNFSVTCIAVGSPPPVIYWTQNGQPTQYQIISDSTSPSATICSTTTPGSTTSILQITSILYSGTYTCNATNTNGSSVQSVNIELQGNELLRPAGAAPSLPQYCLYPPLPHLTLPSLSPPSPLLPLNIFLSSFITPIPPHPFTPFPNSPFLPPPPPSFLFRLPHLFPSLRVSFGVCVCILSPMLVSSVISAMFIQPMAFTIDLTSSGQLQTGCHEP